MANGIKEVEIAIKAKVGVIWLRSTEEIRIERSLAQLADANNYELWTWRITQGMQKIGSEEAPVPETRDFSAAIATLLGFERRTMLLILDLSPWLADPLVMRTLKDVHRALPIIPKEKAKQVIIVDSTAPPTQKISGITVIDWQLPDREAMGGILDNFVAVKSEEFGSTPEEQAAITDKFTNGNRDNLIGAMLGLTAEDAANALARSWIQKKAFDVDIVSSEKKRVVQGSGLEWYEPDRRGMNAIGGNQNLKAWLATRRRAFTSEARDYGLPVPKGCLLVGIPGCGKSLTAKCISAAWNMPLLRMDVGALFSKYVGESEDKVRSALKVAETIAPCILWIDEIEKAFNNAGGEGDGGTSARVFGTFLTWMQEQRGVFIVATANDVSKLPPEFLRAGRWDDLWFISLPNTTERTEIAAIMGKKYTACEQVHPAAVANSSFNNTGAEIEQAYIDAMYKAFEENRKVTTEDVTQALKCRVPLATTMKEKIDTLRAWAKGRARMASDSAVDKPLGNRETE